MQEASENIKKFLQFVALQFIKHPEDAQLRITEPDEENPRHLRFRLILNQADVPMLIGRNGFTASAIRNVLKAAAIQHDVTATLQILSHEEERQRIAAYEAGEIIEDSNHHDEHDHHHDEADDEHLEEQ